MANRILVIEDLKERSLEEVLREVISRKEVLTVRLPEGGVVIIKPTLQLEPLPELEGYVPEGWKDALYG